MSLVTHQPQRNSICAKPHRFALPAYLFHNSKAWRAQRGVGLIEILVAVVLISIGFLAVAVMQVRGMSFSQSAYHQSQAYFLANDMIDRMRGNIGTDSGGLTGGDYDNVKTQASPKNPNCDTKFCSATEIAQQDIFEWSAALHPILATDSDSFVPALPSTENTKAEGMVEPLGGGLYRVTMTWGEIIGSDDKEQTLSINFVAAQ